MGLKVGNLFQHRMVKIKLASHAIHHLANLDETDQKRWGIGFGHGMGEMKKGKARIQENARHPMASRKAPQNKG